MTVAPPDDGPITRVELTCHRIGALRSFYGETLGLPVEGDSEELRVSAGTTEVIFRPAAEHADGRYHLAFEVPEGLVREAADWLAERTPLLPDQGQVLISRLRSHSDSCYAFDPAGNSIELIGRHRLPDPVVRPFGPQHIRRVSEVGVVVQDVGALVKRLEEQLGIGVSAGRQSPTITLRGSDLGLLVVVQQGDSWFPAGPHAVSSPLVMHLKSQSHSRLTVPSQALTISLGPVPPAMPDL